MTGYSEISPERKEPALPARVTAVLVSWGLAVLILASLLSWWIRDNQIEQDRDMCELISVFMGGPEPVPGPAGDRARAVQEAISRYHGKRHCPEVPSPI